MGTVFMTSENSKTRDPHRLLLSLMDKINFKKLTNMFLYRTLTFIIHGKIYKNHTKVINLKHQLRHGMKSLNYLIDHILHQISENVS